MEDIKKNLDMIRGEIAETAQQCGRSADDVLLVAVSKTRTPEEINVAIDAGVTDIGENKVQEIMDKLDVYKRQVYRMYPLCQNLSNGSNPDKIGKGRDFCRALH